MKQARLFKAIGLMSGTSLDGIDIALIETDGRDFVSPGASHYVPYAPELKERIRSLFGRTERDYEIDAVEEEITLLHAAAIREFLAAEEKEAGDINVIGFHGQTITHKPKEGFTWQLGDGMRLATETGIDVVHDFRTADVKAGGEGAPLIPLYHQALARQKKIRLPVVFLNIGGVANVTWIGEEEDNILAFDTGPGNALMDDFMKKQFGQSYDFAGTKAKEGIIHEASLDRFLSHEYLKRPPPKSLDRGFVPDKGAAYTNPDMNSWDVSAVWDLSPEDAMATLSALTVETIAAARAHFPQPAKAWYVCGGGRHNDFMLCRLQEILDTPVRNINDLGYNGDAIEAEGFAYLAVRHLLDLPLSLPTTTGVSLPAKGGILNRHR